MWSPQQDKALRRVSSWLRSDTRGQQLFRLFGYAGTGKTTLARHLAEGVEGHVIFAAYTGKAASVLRASGATNARTLHSLIYSPRERSDEFLRGLKMERDELLQMYAEARAEEPPDWPGRSDWDQRLTKLAGDIRRAEKNASRPDFTLNMESDLRDAALLVVDECSMVGEEMAGDIMSFGVPVLVLGDPAQLPPVQGDGFFTNAEPDVMLTEIHRQALDNPIVSLATRVRSGQALDLGRYGESSVIRRATPELAEAADQVLVGMNKTRRASNRRLRELKGFVGSSFPLAGEKLVCLRNDKETGLLNGTLHVTTLDAEPAGDYVNLRIRPEDAPEAQPLLVSAHPQYFNGDPETIGRWERREAQEFDFGWAMTVHKAQGSQWQDVLVIDESGVFRDRETSRRWLYTAITRAQERVTIVR